MSKYQEALHKLIKHIDFPNSPQRAFDSSKDEPRKYYIALQELVDKVTPKKVVLHYKHHLGTAWGTFVSRITCPSCNRRLKDKIPNNQLFCPTCGQALEWSDDK